VAVFVATSLSWCATSAGAAQAAPTKVHATGNSTSILVRWARPAGATHFVVAAHPGDRTCATSKTKCVVKGLSLDGRYEFTVIAKGAGGSSVRSTSSNRVHVLSARSYFSTVLGAGKSLVTKYQSDYLAANTEAAAAPYLKKMSAAFSEMVDALGIEAWPISVRGKMSRFVTALRSYGTDAVYAVSSDSPESWDTFESVLNTELINEKKILTDLKISTPIVGPISTSPGPGPINTVETIHDFDGDAFTVLATQIVDPASAATGTSLPGSGERLVAVDLTLDNSSGYEVDGDANEALTLIGSDGQTYAANYQPVTQCTNFGTGSGLIDLAAGSSASGCVVFELPTSVTVRSIWFSLAAGYLDVAEWTN
jgi:hypothetical protein